MKQKQKQKTTYRKLEYRRTESIYLIIRGLEVGIAAGLISAAYRYLLTMAETYLLKVINYVSGSIVKTVLWFAALVLMAVITASVVKYVPLASSSGIPQITGEVKGYLDAPWWQVILAKIIGGTLSIFSGLSLGREGPSIQLGGMASKGVARITKSDKTTELRMISCGGGAGLAAAFNAPLAGVMFILEEIHRTIDKSIICMGIVAAITADFVSKIFFGQDNIFNYESSMIPLRYYWILVLLGIVLGLAGVGYNYLMLLGQKLMKKIPLYIRTIFVFIISGIISLYIPDILGGGHAMVNVLMTEQPKISVLIFLLLTKFLFSMLSFGSGVPGGIFFPLLILGTYIGAIYGDLTISLFGLSTDMWQEFVVVAMAGFFAAIVRAPLTGIILVFEMTGNLNSLLPLATVSLISYAVANLCGSSPIYESLLENIVKNKITKDPKMNKKSEKVLKTYVVPVGSPVKGKNVADIDWGKHCLIVSIDRGDFSVTPKGDTIIKEGDTLIIMISQRRFSKDNERIEKIIGSV